MNEVDQAPSMPTSRKVLCGVYLAIAIAAAVAAVSQVGPYAHSFTGVFVTFWQDTKVTSAGRFVVGDLLFLALAVAVLLVVEARKHDIKYVWVYLIGGIFVGISITVPLFLLARELKLRGSAATRLRVFDTLLLAVFAVGVAAMVIWIDVG
jgi:uncharacterized protein DUF2834